MMSINDFSAFLFVLGTLKRYGGSDAPATRSDYPCNQRTGPGGEESAYDLLQNDACRQRAANAAGSSAVARPAASSTPGAPLDIRPAIARTPARAKRRAGPVT